jgi:hypothetical protein
MEAEAVRERLDTRGLTNGKSPVLLRVDVPVAIFGHVSRDGQARLIGLEDVVFVAETVFS